MFEPIGTFCERVDIYLQDPVYCNRDVPYRNPHVLAEEDGIITTGSLSLTQEVENFTSPGDIFDQLLTTDTLPEARTPQVIRTTLHRYGVVL